MSKSAAQKTVATSLEVLRLASTNAVGLYPGPSQLLHPQRLRKALANLAASAEVVGSSVVNAEIRRQLLEFACSGPPATLNVMVLDALASMVARGVYQPSAVAEALTSCVAGNEDAIMAITLVDKFLPLLDCASSETLVRRVLTPRPGLLSALLVGVGRRRRSPIDNALAVVTACLEFDQDGEVLLFLVGRGADFIELAPRALLRVRDPCRLLQIAPSVARVSLTPQELSLQALELLADCLHDEYSLPDPSLFEICQPSSAVGMLVALMSLLRLEVCELRPVAAFLLRGCELVTDRRTGVIRHAFQALTHSWRWSSDPALAALHTEFGLSPVMDFSPRDVPPLRLTHSHCYLACLDAWLDVADFKDTRNLVTSGSLTTLSRVLVLASLSLRLSDRSVAVSLAPCAVLVWLHQTYLPALTCQPGSDWRTLSGSSVYGEELIGPLVALSHAAFTAEDVVAPVVLVALVGSLGKAKELVQPLFRLLSSHSSSFLGRVGLLSLYLSGSLASSKMAQSLGGDEHSLLLLRQMSVFRPVESYSVVARHASSTILSHPNDSLMALLPAVLAGEADPEPVLRRFHRNGAWTLCDSLGVLALCSVFLGRELEPQLVLRLKEQTDGGFTEEPLLRSAVASLFAATESHSPSVRRYAYRILSGLLPLILRVFHSGDDAVLAILPSKDCLQPSFVETLRSREIHPLCVDAARALMTDVLFLEREHLGRQKIQLQQGPSPLVKPLSLLMNPKKLQGDVSKISVACYGDLFLFSPQGPANQPQDKAKIWTRFASNLTKLLKDFRLPQGTSMMDQAFAETLVMEGFIPYVRRYLASSAQEESTLKDFMLQRLSTQITVPLLLVSAAVSVVLQDAKWLLPTLQRELMGPTTPAAFSCLAVLLREGLETCESWHAFRALLGLKGHFSSETAVAVQKLADLVAAEMSDVPRLQNGSVDILFNLFRPFTSSLNRTFILLTRTNPSDVSSSLVSLLSSESQAVWLAAGVFPRDENMTSYLLKAAAVEIAASPLNRATYLEHFINLLQSLDAPVFVAHAWNLVVQESFACEGTHTRLSEILLPDASIFYLAPALPRMWENHLTKAPSCLKIDTCDLSAILQTLDLYAIITDRNPEVEPVAHLVRGLTLVSDMHQVECPGLQRLHATLSAAFLPCKVSALVKAHFLLSGASAFFGCPGAFTWNVNAGGQAMDSHRILVGIPSAEDNESSRGTSAALSNFLTFGVDTLSDFRSVARAAQAGVLLNVLRTSRRPVANVDALPAGLIKQSLLTFRGRDHTYVSALARIPTLPPLNLAVLVGEMQADIELSIKRKIDEAGAVDMPTQKKWVDLQEFCLAQSLTSRHFSQLLCAAADTLRTARLPFSFMHHRLLIGLLPYMLLTCGGPVLQRLLVDFVVCGDDEPLASTLLGLSRFAHIHNALEAHDKKSDNHDESHRRTLALLPPAWRCPLITGVYPGQLLSESIKMKATLSGLLPRMVAEGTFEGCSNEVVNRLGDLLLLLQVYPPLNVIVRAPLVLGKLTLHDVYTAAQALRALREGVLSGVTDVLQAGFVLSQLIRDDPVPQVELLLAALDLSTVDRSLVLTLMDLTSCFLLLPDIARQVLLPQLTPLQTSEERSIPDGLVYDDSFQWLETQGPSSQWTQSYQAASLHCMSFHDYRFGSGRDWTLLGPLGALEMRPAGTRQSKTSDACLPVLSSTRDLQVPKQVQIDTALLRTDLHLEVHVHRSDSVGDLLLVNCEPANRNVVLNRALREALQCQPRPPRAFSHTEFSSQLGPLLRKVLARWLLKHGSSEASRRFVDEWS